ncbi:MAG: isoprenyl transferase [Planctomycetota bacterium]|jgi:undecaprenyl diphosphate synthase
MALFRRKVANSELPPRERMPRHVAIIMDGNGRWAQARGLPRIEGHRQGAKTVERTLNACKELGIPYLTLYCFSNENWKRPKAELDFLMGLLKTYLMQQSETLVAQGIRLKVIGRRDGLPADVLEIMDQAVAISALADQFTLCLAINYGSRQELVDAIRSLANRVQDGTLRTDEIDEATIGQALYTHGIPDPDLVIRTSGELRLSNFLLWQISYSELWVTEKLWPEFSREDFVEAVIDFANRNRRFGAVDATDPKT